MEYRAFYKNDPSDEITHWKYIRREKVGDKYRYYYDESKGEKGSGSNKTDSGDPDNKTKETKPESSEGFVLDEIANKIIRGEFSNGSERKDLLGESYDDVQHRVNEILLGEQKAKEILERRMKKQSKE